MSHCLRDPTLSRFGRRTPTCDRQMDTRPCIDRASISSSGKTNYNYAMQVIFISSESSCNVAQSDQVKVKVKVNKLSHVAYAGYLLVSNGT